MAEYSGHNDAFDAFIAKAEECELKRKQALQKVRDINDRQKNYIFKGDISQIKEYNEALDIGLGVLAEAIERGWHIVSEDTPISFVIDSKIEFSELEEADDYDVKEIFREHNIKYYYEVSNILTNWAIRRIYDIGVNSRKGNTSCLNTPLDNLLYAIGLCSRNRFIPWHTNKFRPEITVDNLKQQGILNLWILSKKYKPKELNSASITTIEGE